MASIDDWVNEEVTPSLPPQEPVTPQGAAPSQEPPTSSEPEPTGQATVEPEPGAEPAEPGTPAPTEPKAPQLSDADLPKWAQSRIDTMTRKMREAQEALEETKRRLSQYEPQQPPAAAPGLDGTQTQPVGLYTESEVMARATQIAAQQRFDAECNSIYQQGKAVFPDWDRRMETIRLAGGIPTDVIEAAMEAGDPHVILAGLAAQPDELARLQGLPPTRIGAAVAKFGQKLSARTPAPKVSAAPLPPENRARGATIPEPDPEKMTMAEFMAYMDEQDAKKASRR